MEEITTGTVLYLRLLRLLSLLEKQTAGENFFVPLPPRWRWAVQSGRYMPLGTTA